MGTFQWDSCKQFYIHPMWEMSLISSSLVCPLCSSLILGNISSLLSHMRLAHLMDKVFQCNLQGCQRTFKNFYTFRNHVYAMHNLSQEQTHESIAESQCYLKYLYRVRSNLSTVPKNLPQLWSHSQLKTVKPLYRMRRANAYFRSN